ncbi:MAG: chorismate mutase [Bacteroidota bacterium]|nr:chorismate mutase [Bacteroidota bacterium]
MIKNKLEIKPFTEWADTKGAPLVIAGPCSAETKDQVLSTAHEIAKIPQVQIFRAGIWKPRTRPNGFEGVGTKGLQWLQEVKKTTRLKTCTEVAKPHHIEEALKHDIDMLWIGARTVVNPFSVQELSEALKGVDIPILIKNPITPDIQLWIGAIERINKAGINKIAVIHRGFHSFEKSPYRNTPMWEIPLELKHNYPEIPIICDPSHISGCKELIKPVSQEALDLNMKGLMIETHNNPNKAFTDAKQQITPTQLQKLLNSLKIRSAISHNKEYKNKLEELRKDIDKLDIEMLCSISKRINLVKEIGKYKNENNTTIFQLERWREITHDRIRYGTSQGLEEDFILDLLKLLHKESIKIQTNILNKKGK